ncbi:MAG: hypothetical protein ABI554_02305 [Flavobacterium sp.]
MVQVLPKVTSFGEEFGRAIGQGAGQGLESGLASRQKMKEMAEENREILKSTGIDLSPYKTQETREAAFKSELQRRNTEGEINLKDQKRQNLLGEISGRSNSGMKDKNQFGERLRGAIPKIEQHLGFKLQPDQIESIAMQMQEGEQAGDEARGYKMPEQSRQNLEKPNQELQEQDPYALAEQYAAIGEHDLAQVATKRATEKIRSTERKQDKSPEFQREQKITAAQADADVKYNQQLQEASKQHELKRQSLNNLDKLNRKGVTGKPYEKFLEKTGLVGLTSDGRREFAADVKNLITDIRSILGSQFTGFEFQTILNAYPSADFSQGANSSIIKNLKSFQDIKEKEVEFAEQLKKENKGKIPEDYQSKVNERVREYAKTKLSEIKENTKNIMNEEYGIDKGFTLMLDNNGEPLSVPDSEIKKYEEMGAILP